MLLLISRVGSALLYWSSFQELLDRPLDFPYHVTSSSFLASPICLAILETFYTAQLHPVQGLCPPYNFMNRWRLITSMGTGGGLYVWTGGSVYLLSRGWTFACFVKRFLNMLLAMGFRFFLEESSSQKRIFIFGSYTIFLKTLCTEPRMAQCHDDARFSIHMRLRLQSWIYKYIQVDNNKKKETIK